MRKNPQILSLWILCVRSTRVGSGVSFGIVLPPPRRHHRADRPLVVVGRGTVPHGNPDVGLPEVLARKPFRAVALLLNYVLLHNRRVAQLVRALP